MRVLVLGASGFIGSHIGEALTAAGHEVARGTRPQFDLSRDHDPAAWRARIAGFDAVVNAVGLIREHGAQTFDAVHVRGPVALFTACAAERVAVIQLSALGADEHAPTRFLATKKAADDALLAFDVPSLVLQPSLVHGAGGASARLLEMMASMPVVVLPGDGAQAIQPVHVEDLAALVVAAVATRHFPRRRMAVVGPTATTLQAYLQQLRASLGLGRARVLHCPLPLVRAAARLRLGLLDRDALAMLERGNVADAAPMAALLGRAPRDAVPDGEVAREGARRDALLAWLLPLLRISIALVWIVAGVVSLGPYPVEDSLALLARTGITGSLAYVALYGAAALDLAMGIATLVLRRRRMLWLLQLAVIIGYTAIITVALPEQWLHPYGPVVKNLPMLAAIFMLYQLERR